jgi:hypothetical protein
VAKLDADIRNMQMTRQSGRSPRDGRRTNGLRSKGHVQKRQQRTIRQLSARDVTDEKA